MSLILSGTDGLSDIDGTAATPAIRGTDANTGIFFGADIIGFSEGGAEVARFDSSGNLGIGTTATTYNYQTKNIALFDASSVGISIVGGAKILTLTAQSSGGIFVGSRSNDNLIFATNDTERMRIDSSGNLLVGTTSQVQTEKLSVQSANMAAIFVGTNTGNVTTLQVRRADTDGDAVTFFRGTTQKGYITVASTGTTYNTLSDYRLKENIQPMVGALEKIAAIKPVTYDWKDIGKTGQGFIAHELKEVVPECVTGDKDELDEKGNPRYQGIDTSFLVATLTAAIQEQQAIITQLQADVAALKGTTP
jgi:hypothetical protein